MEMRLDSLANGAVAEKFNAELETVLKNCMDLNTDFKKARTVTLKCSLKPSAERDEVAVEFEVKSTLAPSMPVGSRLIVGKDNEGKVQAAEYQRGQLPGQAEFDPETGEVKEGIIDFRNHDKQAQQA